MANLQCATSGQFLPRRGFFGFDSSPLKPYYRASGRVKAAILLAPLLGASLAFGQTPSQSPWNPTDAEFRQMVTVWTKVVDDTNLHAVNKAKATGEEADPDAEIEPFLETLAHDPYFDVNREAQIHPSHRKYVERIAELRGWKLRPQNHTYEVARGLIVLTLIGWLLGASSGRVARKTSVKSGASRGSFYRLVLLKMSWRILLVVMICLTLIIMSDTVTNESDAETARKIVAVLPGLLLICCTVVLVWSWKATKSRFRPPPQAVQPS